MAFEDRCSPNQANSPGPMANGSPTNPSSPSSPNPNERALKPYTCSTISSKYDRSKSPSDRMISSNMVYVKSQGVTPLPINMVPNGIDGSMFLPNRNIIYNPYLNPYVAMNGNPHLRSFAGAGFESKPSLMHHQAFSPPLNAIHQHPDNQQNNVNNTGEQNINLQFSISNILHPEFGLNAIRKSTNKIEGPKAGGPVQSILYKPYELSRQAEARNIQVKHQNDYLSARNLSSKKMMEIRNARLPLGGLHHAVSQIGVVKPVPKVNGFSDPIRSSHQIERPKNFAGFQSSSMGGEESSRSECRPGSANSSISTASSSIAAGSDDGASSKAGDSSNGDKGQQWPAWVYCTRYSDRPSSGPRSRRSKKKPSAPSAPAAPVVSAVSSGGSNSISVNGTSGSSSNSLEDKRPRTAFSGSQLARLKHEFAENRYLTERRRQQLSSELGLNEAQIKIWFQNKRAKIKKASGQKNPLALQLMAQGLYNHGTASCSEGEDEDVEVGSVAGN